MAINEHFTMTRFLCMFARCILLAMLACCPIARKILCLHGGGGSGQGFQDDPGMVQLQVALPDFDFVYAHAPHGDQEGASWLRDPPGGKDEPTIDPEWAAASNTVLDGVVAGQGPFFGILGYSQGSAMVPVYLAHAPVGTFQMAILFCGYLTTTHEGVLANVRAASPFGNIPALVWMGAEDSIISNPMTAEQATVFTSPTVVTSPAAGHHVPESCDSTFGQVIAFVASQTSPPQAVVQVSMGLTVTDPATFVNEAGAEAAVEEGVATSAGVDASAVTAVLSVGRRLAASAVSVRRLQGNVNVDAVINVADADAAASISFTVEAITLEEITTSLNAALEIAGVTADVTVATLTAATGTVSTTPAPQTCAARPLGLHRDVALLLTATCLISTL